MATNYVLVDFENVQPDMSALAGTAHRVIVFFGAKQQSSRHHFDKFDSLLELGANLERVKVPYSGKNALDMHIAFQIGRIHEKDPGASFLILSRDTDFDPLIEYLKGKGVEIARAKDVGGLAKPPAVVGMGAVPRKGRQAQGSQRKVQAAKGPQGQKPVPAEKARPMEQTPRVQKPQPAQRPQQAMKPQHAPRAQNVPKMQHATKSQPQKATSPQRPSAESRVEPAQFDQIVKQLRSMSGKPKTRKRLEQTIASYFKHHGGEKPELVLQTIEELVRSGMVAQAGTKVTYQLG